MLPAEVEAARTGLATNEISPVVDNSAVWARRDDQRSQVAAVESACTDTHGKGGRYDSPSPSCGRWLKQRSTCTPMRARDRRASSQRLPSAIASVRRRSRRGSGSVARGGSRSRASGRRTNYAPGPELDPRSADA